MKKESSHIERDSFHTKWFPKLHHSQPKRTLNSYGIRFITQKNTLVPRIVLKKFAYVENVSNELKTLKYSLLGVFVSGMLPLIFFPLTLAVWFCKVEC
jgi:hypothetical protein